ncbi:MAG: glycosyltransferase family 39 protein [Candidatus Omnitrophota bacterium]
MKKFFKGINIPLSLLAVITVIGCLLRIFLGYNLTLNADEAGVTLLQASGQAVQYEKNPIRLIAPLEKFKAYINYSDRFGLQDVIDSLQQTGLHPPFYYLFLHLILKLFGSHILILRGVSIGFSILSIALIYRVGSLLVNREVGLLSALFLSVSTFGVHLGVMVRPYPLAMLLSLVSTALVLEIILRKQTIKEGQIFFGYGVVALIGLYTVYHFVFVIIFQVLLLCLFFWGQKEVFKKILITLSLVMLGYFLWVPSVFRQLNFLDHVSYFQGSCHNLAIVQYPFDVSFFALRKLLMLPLASFFVLKALWWGTLLAGISFFLKKRTHQLFLLSIGIYFCSLVLADRCLGTCTLAIPKLFFFIMPLVYIIFAIGISRISNKIYLKTIAVTFFTTSLLLNTVYSYHINPGIYTKERYVPLFQSHIEYKLEDRKKGLLILCDSQRRYVFPLIYALKAPLDVLIIPNETLKSTVFDIKSWKEYRHIFVVNFLGDENKNLPVISLLGENLERNNFSKEGVIKVDQQSLQIYRKTDAAL